MSNELPHVLSINRSYAGYGATNPFFACLDNQEEAVVKYLNNNEGNRSLINEYISYSLAKKIDVRIPNFGLCLFDEESNNNTNFVFCDNNYGPAFYTAFIKTANPLLSSSIKIIKNKENFINTLILDHIIYNKDRHSGNYLVNQKGVLYAIDHSHVLKNQCIWNKYTFIQGMNNDDYLDKNILEDNEDTYNILFNALHLTRKDFDIVRKQVKNELTPKYIKEILSQIPKDWKEDVSNEDFIYLEKYINYRIEHIDEIIDLICEERGIK